MVTYCCAYGCKEYYKTGGPVTFHKFPQDEIRRKEWEILIRRANFKATNYTSICSKHFEEECFDRKKFGGTWLKADAKPTIFNFPSHVKPKKTCSRSLKRNNRLLISTINDSTAEVQNIISPFSDFAEDVMNEMHSISKEKCLKSSEDKTKVNYPTLNDCDADMKEIYRVILPKEKCYNLLKTEDAHPSTFVASGPAAEKQKMLRYLGDFTDDDMNSPEKARRALFVARRESLKSRTKIQSMRRKIKRLDDRFAKVRKRMFELERKVHNPNSACDVFEDGKLKTWALMRVHDSVGVIIYNSTRQVLVFVKQFRPSVYYSGVKLEDCEGGDVDVAKYPVKLGMAIELCAGVVDKDQSFAETVRDEVLEECGYDVSLSAVQKVTSYRAGVGVAGAIQTLFYVEVTDSMKVSEGGGNDSDGEFIEAMEINLSQARSLIYDEKVARPASLLFALMWFFDHKAPSKLNQKL